MRLIIAGGGTGGHLYPGMAVAEEVLSRPGGDVLFVGTARGIEARVVPAAGYNLQRLSVSALKGAGPLGIARGLSKLPLALAEAHGVLRRFRPDVVLGVGGYASGPLMLAAALSRYPTAISEQNSVPGLTNRFLGRMADVIFLAFEDARARFGNARIHMTGNPVRRRFLETSTATGAMTPGDEPTLLVVGGSQGARAVNDLMLATMKLFAQRGRVPRVVHQTGSADAERCVQCYRAAGVADRVSVAAFLEDMPRAYHEASLVVGRAGALTLAELAIVSKPAVLIPLPTAADNHQRRNADEFARAGAAVVLEQGTTTAAQLADTLTALLADHERLSTMATAMAAFARPRAAVEIVDELEKLSFSHTARR